MELQEIAALADLARLRFSPEELQTFADEFAHTLEFVDQLFALDTQGVAFMKEVDESAQCLRADVVRPSMDHDEVLSVAPQTDGAGFLIPKVL